MADHQTCKSGGSKRRISPKIIKDEVKLCASDQFLDMK